MSKTVSSLIHQNASCDYYYSRSENAGPAKNETVTEEHWRVTNDGKVPYWLRDKLPDNYWWSLRTPSLVRVSIFFSLKLFTILLVGMCQGDTHKVDVHYG